MKVLVTGATGGIGRLVTAKLIEKGMTVIATSSNRAKAEQANFSNKVNYITYDISSPQDIDLYSYFEKPDSVIHLAWDKLDNYKSDLHTTTILENQKTFVSNLITNGLKDFTGVGTCYEYGMREGILKEDFESKPVIPYPLAKNLLREFIEDLKIKNDFSFKWIRIFYVFGGISGRKNLYAALMNAIAKDDKEFNMSGGEQIRDFLTPEEITEIIVKISLQNKVQGIINCCSGKPVKLKDFVSDFFKKNNYQVKLNLGYYPYADYEPMQSWGSTDKLLEIIKASPSYL